MVIACASVQPPPGGPPDSSPPVLLGVSPDSGAVVEGWRDPLVLQFDEVIDERSGGGLERLIFVSPVPRSVDIDWRRRAIAVRPAGGWRAGTTYHVTLEPGVVDLRGNRLTTGKTVIFSTGGPLPVAAVTGTVVDWEARRLQPRALVQAVLLPDSLTYVGAADSSGAFHLGALPPGRYLVAAVVDANNNKRRDGRESFDSATIQLDSLIEHTFWAFRHDTVGPSLSRATLVDSQAVRLEFSQALPPTQPDSGTVSVLELPDSQPLPVKAVWLESAYDSVHGTTRAAARPSPADTAVPDTLGLERGGVAPPPVAGVAPPTTPDLPPRVAAPPAAGRAAPADTGRVAQILQGRPRLSTGLVVELDTALTAGSRYVVVAAAVNLNGARNTSRTLLIVPARAEAPPR